MRYQNRPGRYGPIREVAYDYGGFVMLQYKYITLLACRSCVVCAAAILLPTLCLAGEPTVTFRKIIWEKIDPFPGRPGDTYNRVTPGGLDAAGNLSLRGQSNGDAGPSITDLLVFHADTGEVVSVQQGLVTHPDLKDNFLSDVNRAIRNQSGAVASHWRLLPQVQGGPGKAFFLGSDDTQMNLAAENGVAVPGQPPGTVFTHLGFVQTLVMRFNDAGTLAVRGSFQIGPDDHLGLYRLDDGQTLTRIYDTTMPVPGHPNASWIPFIPSLGVWPFDAINTMQLSDTGDLFWQGVITENEIAYPTMFRQAPDGEIRHVLGGPHSTVPNRPPGIVFRDFEDFLASGNGTVAIAGQANTLDMGIYAALVGQPFQKIHDNTDPIPDIPEASGFSIHTLSAVNDRGDIVYAGSFNGPPHWPNGGGGSAVVLKPADGPKELVLRYDQLPGQPEGAFMHVSSPAARLNNRGDVIVSGSVTNGATSNMAYMYLKDRRELVAVLVPGTMIDGMFLVDWNYIGWTNYGGGLVEFSDDRSFVAKLRFAGPDLVPFTADDVRGLYMVDVEADLIGDMNCDGTLDGRDVTGFVAALTDPDGFPVGFPDCDADNADVNRDGLISTDDVDGFVLSLIP
ncbi:MAG: hypothetical protein MI923_00700 [Phycisphaerales bacterium]|nr:hypothetical protein [Phycisphaerales bacterium]